MSDQKKVIAFVCSTCGAPWPGDSPHDCLRNLVRICEAHELEIETLQAENQALRHLALSCMRRALEATE